MAFPDYTVTDDFNRADENPLSGGGLWSGPLRAADGRLKIVSNQVAHATGAGATGTAYYTVPLVSPFQIWCEIPDASGDQGIDYCSQEPNQTNELQGYRWQSNGSVLQLYRVAEGAYTKVAGDYAIVLANGDALGVHLDGSAHKLYHRTGGVWSLIDTFTDAGGYHGSGRRLAAAFWNGTWDQVYAAEVPKMGGTEFMRLVTGVVYIFTGPTKLGGFLVFSCLGFWGLYGFYRAFRIGAYQAPDQGAFCGPDVSQTASYSWERSGELLTLKLRWKAP